MSKKEALELVKKFDLEKVSKAISNIPENHFSSIMEVVAVYIKEKTKREQIEKEHGEKVLKIKTAERIIFDIIEKKAQDNLIKLEWAINLTDKLLEKDKVEEAVKIVAMAFSSNSDYTEGLPQVIESILNDEKDYITVNAIED
ncbi:hypothetical protein [Persephonella sp. KM09-Lau-8]|uniref:hypothetical protein n=1 Tax=Persephonella sp. KM09-Lau-8 TaxID=1158345 RepID=UPI000495E1EC|nr:hypothetical protein [Persephonella sp. KM09-Lau-8]